MSTGDLPPWPEAPEHTERLRGISANGITFPEAQKLLVLMYYERARAEAAIARLRKAVEVLKRIDNCGNTDLIGDWCEEALALIGELPKERT
jgi:hypothetical protein